ILDRIRPFLDRVHPILDRIRPFLDRLSPILDRIRPFLDRVHPILDRFRASPYIRSVILLSALPLSSNLLLHSFTQNAVEHTTR
ncbi:hypothetical protein, partial [Virgibacillus sp. MG-45]|uniref:hypothetical protein n=1 Tax=Virgibacillus sp. MG-45 TaxID=3102791 RepID=UPI002ED95754